MPWGGADKAGMMPVFQGWRGSLMRFSWLWDVVVRGIETLGWTLDVHWELVIEFTRRSAGDGM